MAPVRVGRSRKPALGLLTRPGMVALIATVVFFVVFLGVLHPGYAINDDIKIIAIAAGYPDVTASPFLVFSNVLLGFLLVPLYKLPTAINWEIALFLAVDMIAAWTLLYFVVSASTPRFYRVMGMVLLLACLSYYPLQITFTSTAALACFTGLFAVLAGASAPKKPSRETMALGCALIFVASLIRIEALALAVPPILAGALVLSRAIRTRPATFALGCAGILVFGGYAVDRLYVRAHPEWNVFYHYKKAAQAIQDSHRLENLDLEIRRISWSKNDQELFARYFYPDPGTFSLDRLQYLVDHVSGSADNPWVVAGAFLKRITSGRAGFSLLIVGSTWLLMLGLSTGGRARWAIPLIASAALAENLALMWLYKNPDYVLFSSMSNAAILAILAVFFAGGEMARARPLAGRRVLALVGGLAFALLAFAGSIRESLVVSHANLENEIAYNRILADLDTLRDEGRLASRAVVISASHGIPWHWSNPLQLKFPNFAYLDTGWNTFSPYYEEALRVHDLQPLAERLYQSERAYVIGKSIFRPFLARFYQEHQDIAVEFETLYQVPGSSYVDGSQGIELFRVLLAPLPVP